MTLKIKVIANRTPGKTEELKYRAVSISRGYTDLDTLAEMVSDQTSMTKADCYGVLIALEYNIIHELQDGRIVQLGNIGSFQVSVSSNTTNTKKEFRSSNIKSAKIIYRPGKGFKYMLKNLSFKLEK